ncbi:hypothetical protein [Geodermatophilus sp. URMC 62]|uniref:hypothetical protein n=1 Tax=Geodermatophilus sp. URMC 62 TaxID=3423414 RepID=UPI00406D33F6
MLYAELELGPEDGVCESCGHVNDWDALHSATPGVYCDDCAHLDGWACDCEPCAESREMSDCTDRLAVGPGAGQLLGTSSPQNEPGLRPKVSTALSPSRVAAVQADVRRADDSMVHDMSIQTSTSASLAAHVGRLVADLPDGVMLVAVTGTSDSTELRTATYTDLGPGTLAALDGFLTPTPEFVALATQTIWSPSDDIDGSEAWLMVAVTADGPALVGIRRLDRDQQWTTLTPETSPWLARGLEKALCNALAGQPLDLRVSILEERVMALAWEDVRDSEDVADELDVVVNVHALHTTAGIVCRYVIPGAVGGPVAPVECSEELHDAILALRHAMHEPGEGTWFVAEFTVTADNHVEAIYDFDEPPSDLTVWPNAQLLAADLALHARTSEFTPDWMTAVLRSAA